MTQIRKNLVTNVMCLITNVLVGLLYTPYLVRELGVATYGVLPIALVINQYIIILTDSLQSSVTRFYSVEYRQKNYRQASVYFTSAIAITILLAIIVVPFICCFLPQIETLLHIPDNLVHSVGQLIAYTVASLFVAVCSNCVNITIYSDNRLDLINYLKILRNLTKLIFNIVLFSFLSTDVANVGLSALLAELLVLVVSIIFYKTTKNREIKFGRRFVDFGAMKPIVKMLTWVSLISFSSVFIYKIDAILTNNYFGLYYTGVLGSISEFGSYCISITAVIGVLFRPLMLIAYSDKRHEDLVQITVNGAYIIGLISGLLCGIVMGISTSLLRVWLNDEIAQYSSWMIIKLLIIPITSFGATISVVNSLWNNVKSCAIWSLLIAVVYMSVVLVLLELGIDMTVFLIMGAIAAILQGAILHISIYKKAYPESTKLVYIQLAKSCLYFMMVFGVSIVIDLLIRADNLYMLFLEICLSIVIGIVLSVPFYSKQNINMLDNIFPIKSILNKFHVKSVE